MNTPLYVSRPSLTPLEEYIPYLETIWKTGIMTHNGPLMRQLEQELGAYLNVAHVVCVANGTCALQLAIRALNLTGDIITTPFTFIATASIIAWERCRPVFVDIDPDTWNLDPHKIEERLTEATTAILPVHVFSAPCDMAIIQAIADKYRLQLIYDAAHAMAVKVGAQSVLSYGNISAVSFHANKVLNTAEGGACITNDAALAQRIQRLRFFGFDAQKNIVDEGMNAKMTELSASLGLANLKWLDRWQQRRRENYVLYRNLLSTLPFITYQKYHPDEYNYSYMPVLFESEEILLRVIERLEQHSIHPRRYFYPALHTLSLWGPQPALPVAERIARTILCLPMYEALSTAEIERVCHVIATV